jgi:hypothetical protein
MLWKAVENGGKWAYCVEKLGLTRSAADFP